MTLAVKVALNPVQQTNAFRTYAYILFNIWKGIKTMSLNNQMP